jgi:hypothetical protein
VQEMYHPLNKMIINLLLIEEARETSEIQLLTIFLLSLENFEMTEDFHQYFNS